VRASRELTRIVCNRILLTSVTKEDGPS